MRTCHPTTVVSTLIAVPTNAALLLSLELLYSALRPQYHILELGLTNCSQGAAPQHGHLQRWADRPQSDSGGRPRQRHVQWSAETQTFSASSVHCLSSV